MRNRLKSWVFWSSLAAQILAVLTATEIIDFNAGENELQRQGYGNQCCRSDEVIM